MCTTNKTCPHRLPEEDANNSDFTQKNYGPRQALPSDRPIIACHPRTLNLTQSFAQGRSYKVAKKLL